eukprot:scaffold232370_cov23-Tisochrysis_lutea.AAC.1
MLAAQCLHDLYVDPKLFIADSLYDEQTRTTGFTVPMTLGFYGALIICMKGMHFHPPYCVMHRLVQNAPACMHCIHPNSAVLEAECFVITIAHNVTVLAL